MSFAYFEWSNPVGTDLDDPDALGRANPALGYRITAEFAAIERAAMSDEEYARERLGIFKDNDKAPQWRVITAANWKASEIARPTDDTPLPTEVTFCLEASPDREWSSITCATTRPRGGVLVEVVARRAGMAWLVDYVAALHLRRKPKAWIVDPRSPASTEVRELIELHEITPTELASADVARAAGSFVDALKAGEVSHFGQASLNEAAATVLPRKWGEQFLFDRWAGDPSALIGVSLARWGHLAIPAVKPRPRVMNLAEFTEGP